MFNDESNEDEENPISFLLKQYFLAPFREPTLYFIDGVPDCNNNNVYESISAIFDNPDLFYEHSRMLASLLYENSSHPQIKTGEFYLTQIGRAHV